MKIAWIWTAAILTSCANTHTLPSASTPAMTVGAPVAKQSVAIRITVPHRTSASKRSAYVSSSTTQLVVNIQTGCPSSCAAVTGYPTTISLTPASPGCSIVNSNTSCQETIALAPGNYTAVLTAEDANASALSSDQEVPFSVVAGTQNLLQFTLGGIPASIAVQPLASDTWSGSVAAGFTFGTCTQQSVTVSALDADGNTIVGPGAPSVTLTTTSNNYSIAPAGGANEYTIDCLGVNAIAASLSAQAVPAAASGGATQSLSFSVNATHTVAGTMSEFTIPTGSSEPVGIAPGPDGALWFTESSADKIGRVTTGGAFTEWAVPTASAEPYRITTGPDGALWFTEEFAGKIGRITTSGEFTEFSTPTANSVPTDIVWGPDGALWFTEYSANKIGRITTSGSITEYDVPTQNAVPLGITPGPDGALWFTEFGAAKIGRITTSGAISEYQPPTYADLWEIASGSNGELWYAGSDSANSGFLGKVTTAGVFSTQTINFATNPRSITAGPNGALWYTDPNFDYVVSVATYGAVTKYTVPGSGSPGGITAGPDGALWFVDDTHNQVDRVQ